MNLSLIDLFGNTVDGALNRSRQLEKKLRKVEALPVEAGVTLLASAQIEQIDDGDISD